MNRTDLRELRLRLETVLETIEELFAITGTDTMDELLASVTEWSEPDANNYDDDPPTPPPPIVPPTPPSTTSPKRGVLRLVPADKPKAEGNVIPIELRQNNVEAAYALYVRASELDETPATYDVAETLYRRAVHLDPLLAIAWTNLGNVRYWRGDTEGAMQIWQRALQVQPNQVEALLNMGIAIDDALEDPEAAIPWYERVLAVDGKCDDAHVRIAECLDDVGKTDRARRHWRRYLELAPQGRYVPDARKALGLQRVK